MNFVAIDFETANADYSSICQIGLAEFCDDKLVNTWSTLVNPEDFFDSFNIGIHGITQADVANSPIFPDLQEELFNKINGKIVVHHMPFDRIALNRACNKYSLSIPQISWLDSARVTRRVWTQFANSGYGLANISKVLDIEFEHHDALQDAIAAGRVICKALSISGLELDDWIVKSYKPIGGSLTDIKANEEGELYGESITFTGALTIPRRDAAIMAAQLGCEVGSSVTKKTTILVVGIQETSRLAGYSKSSKHRKAEELISSGQSIKILSEKDFQAILEI